MRCARTGWRTAICKRRNRRRSVSRYESRRLGALGEWSSCRVIVMARGKSWKHRTEASPATRCSLGWRAGVSCLGQLCSGQFLLLRQALGIREMPLLNLGLHITRSVADSFRQQVALEIIGPVTAALLGGLLVTLISQRIQNRRVELREEEERKRAELHRRGQLSLDIMRIAFSFYMRLIEATRVEQHVGEDAARIEELRPHYEQFRIDARVLEKQLRVYIPGGEARWLWHGAVDMLSLRYYRLAHKGSRLDAMIRTHAQHPNDRDIPPSIRPLFLSLEQLHSNDRVEFHDKVMTKFEEMLKGVINLVMHRQLDPADIDPVVSSPGRGSRLGRPSSDGESPVPAPAS